MRSPALAACLVLFAASFATAEETVRRIDNFSLQDHRGQQHRLEDLAEAKVVVVAFLGCECPQARLYAPRLQELAERFEPQGVKFLGVMSNRQDAVTEIGHFARDYGVKFPLLKDTSNTVADQFGAERTPEVFVLDAQRQVRYRGRIDDQYGRGSSTGYAKTAARHSYLAEAVEALLAGRDPAESHVPALGCLIGRVREADEHSDVTYGDTMARLLQKHCVECHRPGQIAPFALTSYDEAAGWAEMMAEVVREQRMPPWHAAPEFGHFANDRRLSDKEKQLFETWAQRGAPAGDLSKVPPLPDYPEGWQLTEPDEVFYMSPEPYVVPAEGVVEYQYFIVDPQWTEDRWVRTAECLIGNRSVVHHVFVFAVPPERKMPMWQGPRSGGGADEAATGQLIAGAAPGTPPYAYPMDGMAFFAPAGTKLLFQMHYTPNGKEQPDRTAVGFTYADPAKVEHAVRTNMAINLGFRIPPGAGNHPVEADREFERDTLLLSLAPHMHLRGKAFRYDLEYPDGKRETILDVPRYDFNWQMIYFLAEPKFVPAGSRLRCLAHFDNSADNPANPDPHSEVRWGDQTWEEMMIGWFHETTDVDAQQMPPGQRRTDRFLASTDKAPALSKRLQRAASQAAGSARHMTSLAREVARIAPQVDRICVAAVEGDQLRFLAVSQSPVLNEALGTTQRTYPADQSALCAMLAGADPVVVDLTSKPESLDLNRAASRLRSSVHIPIRVDGQPLLVSFWSREADAFPPEAVKFLEEVAAHVGRARAEAADEAD